MFCKKCGSKLNDNAVFCVNCGEKVPLDNNQATVDISGQSYAGFWMRFLAILIDGLVLQFISFMVGFAIGFLFYKFINSMTEEQLNNFGKIIGYVCFWFYYTILESSSWQATIGKKLLKIKVVDENGNKLTFNKAAIRSVSKYLSMITLFIGYIMTAFTKNKQALHDLVAHTFVIKA